GHAGRRGGAGGIHHPLHAARHGRALPLDAALREHAGGHDGGGAGAPAVHVDVRGRVRPGGQPAVRRPRRLRGAVRRAGIGSTSPSTMESKPMLGRRVRTALLLLSIAAPCAAQIPASEYAARRAALAERIGTGVVLAFGATQLMNDAASYRQLPAFNYLTGFQEPDAAFLMVARDGRPSYAMLYVPARDPRMQLYDGFPPDSAETLARLGLGVRTLDALRPTLDTLVAAGLPVYSVWDFASRDYARTDSLTRGRRFVELLREAHPGADVRDAHPHIDALRLVKSPAEVALLRKAVDITTAALEDAMRALRPGMNEAELQTIVESGFRMRGAEGPSFRSIIGSGPNSTSYHYRANDREMQAGDVVVMDVGALYRGYAADVTRTLPVSGTFT